MAHGAHGLGYREPQLSTDREAGSQGTDMTDCNEWIKNILNKYLYIKKVYALN